MNTSVLTITRFRQLFAGNMSFKGVTVIKKPAEENNKTEKEKNNKSIEERGNLTHNIQKTNNNHSDIDINNNAKPFNSLELPNISPSII